MPDGPMEENDCCILNQAFILLHHTTPEMPQAANVKVLPCWLMYRRTSLAPNLRRSQLIFRASDDFIPV